MLDLRLDRLLETCGRRNGTDVLLIDGRPPMVRLGDGLREMQTGPVSGVVLDAVVADAAGPADWRDRLARGDGVSFDYAYRSETGARRFRFHLIPTGNTALAVISVVDGA